MYIEPGTAVVPRTAVVFFEKTAADVLAGQDGGRVDAAADDGRESANQMIHGFDEGGATIDREHPHGGLTEKLAVILAQAFE